MYFFLICVLLWIRPLSSDLSLVPTLRLSMTMLWRRQSWSIKHYVFQLESIYRSLNPCLSPSPASLPAHKPTASILGGWSVHLVSGFQTIFTPISFLFYSLRINFWTWIWLWPLGESNYKRPRLIGIGRVKGTPSRAIAHGPWLGRKRS